MAVKLIFMLKRKPGVTKEQFREHYEKSHSVLGRKYIGHLLTGYHRNYPVHASLSPSKQRETGEPSPEVDFEWDVITEMRVKDQAAVEEMVKIFNDPEIGPIFVEDEHRFLDRDQVLMLVCDEMNTGTELNPGEEAQSTGL